MNLALVEEMLADSERRYEQAFRAHLQREGEYQALCLAQDRLRSAIATLDEQITAHEQAASVVEQASQAARAAAVETMQTLVTQALQAVFGPDYTCAIELKDGGPSARPEAEFRVISTGPDGQAIAASPQDARGGGVVDVVALAVRLAYAELSRFRPATIFLDEPTKFLASPEYRTALADFLATYCRQFDRQVVVITQSDELVHSADRSWYVQQIDGVSQATPVDRSRTS